MKRKTQLSGLLFLVSMFTFSVFAQTLSPSISIAGNTNGLVQYHVQNLTAGTQVFTLFGDGTFSLQRQPKHKFAASSTPYTTETWIVKAYDPNIPPKRTVMVNVSGSGSTYRNPTPKMAGDLDLLTSWSTAKGYETYYIIAFRNPGSTMQSGCIEFKYNTGEITVNTAGIKVYNNWVSNRKSKIISGIGAYNRKLKWDFSNLNSGETRYVYIPIQPALGTKIGDIVNVDVKYMPSCSTVGSTSKNRSFITQKYPHDPNFKIVNKACIQSDYNEQQLLEYTVGFFNDGENFAKDVLITDRISSKLLPGSVQVIDSEYSNYKIQITPNPSNVKYPNILKIDFKGINLPGTQQINQNTNEFYTYDEASTYIKFRIWTQANISDDVYIKNRVGIIFDDQSAVYTDYAKTYVSQYWYNDCVPPEEDNNNRGTAEEGTGEENSETTVSQKEKNLGTEEGLFLKAYPNPFKDRVTIAVGLRKEKPTDFRLKIVDYSGNVIKELYHNKESIKTFHHTVHFKSLPKGLYLIVLQTPEKTITKKLINH